MEPQNISPQPVSPVSPVLSVLQPQKRKSLLLVVALLILVLVILGAYFYFSPLQSNKGQIFETMTQQESLTYLESIGKTKFASVSGEKESSVAVVPVDVTPLLPNDGPTKISEVTFANGLSGYKISFESLDKSFDEAQQYFSSQALLKHIFVEGGRNPANTAVLMTFENTEYFLKINLLRTSNTSSGITIIVMPKE